MAKFLTTAGVSYHIENLIITAEQELYLISPYLQLSDILFQRLTDADSINIDIKIIYGKEEINAKERSQLESLENLSLYFLKNLHAKCYFNESTMIISSMNMYQFSEKTNREMGILIEANETELYPPARREADSILNAAEIVPKKEKQPTAREESFQKEKSTAEGFCIRCHTSIPLNAEKPYCKNCYHSWVVYENPSYPEKHCHSCGKKTKSSMAKPVCRPCYSVATTTKEELY